MVGNGSIGNFESRMCSPSPPCTVEKHKCDKKLVLLEARLTKTAQAPE